VEAAKGWATRKKLKKIGAASLQDQAKPGHAQPTMGRRTPRFLPARTFPDISGQEIGFGLWRVSPLSAIHSVRFCGGNSYSGSDSGAGAFNQSDGTGSSFTDTYHLLSTAVNVYREGSYAGGLMSFGYVNETSQSNWTYSYSGLNVTTSSGSGNGTTSSSSLSAFSDSMGCFSAGGSSSGGAAQSGTNSWTSVSTEVYSGTFTDAQTAYGIGSFAVPYPEPSCRRSTISSRQRPPSTNANGPASWPPAVRFTLSAKNAGSALVPLNDALARLLSLTLFLGHQNSLSGGPVFGVRYRQAVGPFGHEQIWRFQKQVGRAIRPILPCRWAEKLPSFSLWRS
jgi:hypothetical protein